MAYFNETQNFRSSIVDGIARFFSTLASSIDLAASSKARMRQIDQLSALSDAELEAKGLRREDIARYVFRDILHF